MKTEDLLTENTNTEKSCTNKDIQKLSKEETIYHDAKLQQKALNTEKHGSKMELVMDKSSWENPLDSMLNCYEEKQIDNVMPVYENEMAGEVTSLRESSMPVSEMAPNALMVENAAYQFFQDLQRDDQGVWLLN